MLAVPAVALGGTTKTYEGSGTADPAAKIELVVVKKDSGKRKIRRITADKIKYGDNPLCASAGRTGELTIRGPFNIRNDNGFRAVEQLASGLGELEGHRRSSPAQGDRLHEVHVREGRLRDRPNPVQATP